MKILTSKQIRQADAYTIKHEPIASVDLMERAASRCVDWIVEHISKDKDIIILSGVGNNGGDGLAIARILFEKDYNVIVYEVCFSKKHSADFLINKERLKQLNIPYNYIENTKQIPQFSNDALVIDAIFGTGLSRAVNRFLARLFYLINQTACTVVSIDMPSGLFAENNTQNNLENIIYADYTLTFESPKLAYFLPETHHFFGELHLLDIELSEKFMQEVKTCLHVSTESQIREIYKNRPRFVHKGEMGRALLIAGSYGKMGACTLSAKACKKSGVGLLTIHAPSCGYYILQTAIPEAMVLVDQHAQYFSEGLETSPYSVVAVGPGIGIKKQTKKALSFLINQCKKPMILDADALNILAHSPELWKQIPDNSIITPHRGEWERISGVSASDSYAQLLSAKQFAKEHNLTIVLKDAITAIISTKGNIYFNLTGNSGMATGGSGDVLTGIITALVAQGYDCLEACRLGTFIHGKAADIAIENEESSESLIAGDIIKFLGRAFKFLKENTL